MFDENKHPRAEDGKFTDGNNDSKSEKLERAERIYNSDPPSAPQNPVKKNVTEEAKTTNSELCEILGQEFKGFKGQAAIDKLIQEKCGHVKGAFHRDDIGDIDLLWGSDTVGLKHIIKQREAQGINANEFLSSLSDTIENGEYFAKTSRGDFEFINNGKIAVIAIEYHGSKITYLLTAFKTRKKAPSKDDA